MSSGRKQEDESAVWRLVTADVTPLRGRNRPVAPATPVKTTPRAKSEKPKHAAVSTAPALVRKAPEPLKLGSVAGVDRRTAERLRRGRLPIDARLDLHGHTRETAHQVLSGFLATACDTGRRTVLIVTGKGQGVLKDAVPRWLNESPNRGRILLVAQAQPKDGGGGALYVLLRRRR